MAKEHLHELDLKVDYAASFDVRKFRVREGLHELYEVELEVVCPDRDVDLDALVGCKARFALFRDVSMAHRHWSGVVTNCSHVGIDVKQLSTYRLTIHPDLWLLTQRRNYRVFQQSSDPDTVLAVLAEWGITPSCNYDASLYPGRKYRVQYAESDFHFVRRLLEDAGITFYFEQDGEENRLVLDDAPQSSPLRPAPISYTHTYEAGHIVEMVTEVKVARQLRPGKYTQRDVDYRRAPEFPLLAEATSGKDLEQRFERFHQNYGAFLFSAPPDGTTPVADDHGAARTDLTVGQRQVDRRLAAKRTDARRCRLRTTAHELKPGFVFHMCNHPREDLAEGTGLLVINTEFSGNALGDWDHQVDAMFADAPYHPPLRTPKPSTHGLESATVVGPDDDEIHTDEYARVRVQFHWDREGKRDPGSSCWIPVSQPWGGSGFGAINIPRVGQEVLVDFLGADPDRPVVVGRVFTKTNPVPYKLPEHRTVSGIRSRSANQMMMGANDGADGVTAPAPTIETLGSQLTPEGFMLGPTELNAALQGQLFGALSPNSETHRWPGSEVTMDDRLGQEVLYMQAERDMNTVVKNSQTAVIGNRRSTKVGGDDVLDVDHQQFIRTGSDRCVKVDATQTHIVTGDIRQQSVTGNQHFIAKELFTVASKHQVHVASETILFTVGNSTLLMKPDFTIIQTPMLFLNPGRDALAAAIATGEAPQTPEEIAAEQRAAAINAFNAQLDADLEAGRIDARASSSEWVLPHATDLPELPAGVNRHAVTNDWIEGRRRATFDDWMARQRPGVYPEGITYDEFRRNYRGTNIPLRMN